MSLLKRVGVDILRAGIPHLDHPALDTINDVAAGNRYVKFIRETCTRETVNELAQERAAQVRQVIRVERIGKAVRNLLKR